MTRIYSVDDELQLHVEEVDAQNRDPPISPLPKMQLSLLLLMQLCEPIAADLILPFLFRMVNETGITQGSEDRTGYYAGIIASTFFLGQTLFTLQWGRLSDRIGRKPVLLTGLVGLTLSLLCFGLSRSFHALVISRFLAGLLNSNGGVLKAMMGEITDDTNAAQGFAFIPMVWSVGSTIAPLIGGMLCHPADSWEWFDRSFWREFPYFLPCATSAAVCLLVCLLALLYLRETAPTKERCKPSLSQSETAPLLDDYQQPSYSPSSRPAAVAPPFKAVITAPVTKCVLNYSLLALTDISFIAILPIYLASTPLSLTPRAIGIFMGGMGIFDGTFQVLCTSALVKRWGAKRMYQIAICAYFPLWALFPIALSTVSAHYYPWSVCLFACIGVMLVTTANMSFTIILLFIRSAVPTPAALGTTNGLAQTMASFMRTIGPGCVTLLFAVSREYQLLDGQLVYIVLVLVTAVTFAASFLLPPTPYPHNIHTI